MIKQLPKLLILKSYLQKALLKKKRVDSATWRTAVAAGCFLGGYRLLIMLCRKYLGSFQLSERTINFLSGGGSCAIALAIDDHFLGSLLVIWWCLRAIRCLLPRSDVAPVAIMSLSASILSPAAFLFRDEHQPAYQKFMVSM